MNEFTEDDWRDQEDEREMAASRREAALERAHDNPMPQDLRRAIADEIEPHTMNVEIDHGDVMTAIAISYPLIRDYLRAHPEA
jgi:hypothetical protein